MVGVVFQQREQAGCGLVVRRPFLFHEDRVPDIQAGRLPPGVILFVVNKHEKRISKPVNLLARILERARGLRLIDTRHLDVHAEFREIHTLCRTALRVGVARCQASLEFMLKIRADGLAISDSEQTFFKMRGFSQREFPGRALQQLDIQFWQ